MGVAGRLGGSAAARLGAIHTARADLLFGMGDWARSRAAAEARLDLSRSSGDTADAPGRSYRSRVRTCRLRSSRLPLIGGARPSKSPRRSTRERSSPEGCTPGPLFAWPAGTWRKPRLTYDGRSPASRARRTLVDMASSCRTSPSGTDGEDNTERPSRSADK